MSTRFKDRYPDFASIEYEIRQAHAERSVAVATAIADGIVAAIRGIGKLFAAKPAARAANGALVAKASVPHRAAHI